MYGITENTKDPISNLPIPVGIHEDVIFEGATFEPLKEGNPPLLQYHFRDKDGNVLKPIIWELDPERIQKMAEDYPKEHKSNNEEKGYKKGQFITPEQAVEIASERFNVFHKHILTKFVDEQTIIEGQKGVNSYATFAKSVVSILEKADLTPVRLKVVYDSKGKWSQLPNFPPFIELMSVPKSESRLRMTSFDNTTPAPPATPVETPETVSSSDGYTAVDDPGF